MKVIETQVNMKFNMIHNHQDQTVKHKEKPQNQANLNQPKKTGTS